MSGHESQIKNAKKELHLSFSISNESEIKSCYRLMESCWSFFWEKAKWHYDASPLLKSRISWDDVVKFFNENKDILEKGFQEVDYEPTVDQVCGMHLDAYYVICGFKSRDEYLSAHIVRLKKTQSK